MSIMIDLPPAMAAEAKEYAMDQGSSLESFLFECLKRELSKRQVVKEKMARLDALVAQSHGRLGGKPYKFNRDDAYEEILP